MFDLIIAGGRVIDGAGNPWYRADVAIRDGRIAAVGHALRHEPARRVLDAGGLIVCPGFVDMHTHSDVQLLANPAHEAKLMQGVTTEVLGQDGLSVAPVNDATLPVLRAQLAAWNGDPPNVDWGWRTVAEFLGRFDGHVAPNVAYLVPHGTIRLAVMGQDDRAPADGEFQRMQEMIAHGMREGAAGMSVGLTYAPGMFATDDELVALCAAAVRPYGGYFCTHHRSYGRGAMEAYRDSIEIGRRAGVPVHLSHAHVSFPNNKGRAPEFLAMVDRARAEGVDVTMDTYPYLAGNTYLSSVLPFWAQAGNPDAVVDRLRDPALRERMRYEVEVTGSDGFHGVPADWSTVQIAGVSTEAGRWAAGKTVAAAAAQAGAPPFDWVCDFLIQERLGVSALFHVGHEENVRAVMQHPAHMAGSDAILIGEQPHPRGWGTFARYLGVYVRELGILTWEQAIRKMTSLPAQRLGFPDRGLLRPGMAADVVCFDPDRVRDTATYERPRSYPEGIPFVFVNGVAVKEHDRHLGNLPGRAIRRGLRTA
ncbi:MAG: D-aminoacylase [Chloroflexi bacterium]|nr:D-aminoacylase [Chloroflexota bacterium]